MSMRSVEKQPSRNRGRISSLGDVLHKLLSSWGIDGKLREQRAVSNWSQIVGPRIAAHTRALRVQDGKVFIAVQSSSWKTELVFLKRDIIARLNRDAGRRVIDDILFVGGETGFPSIAAGNELNQKDSDQKELDETDSL
jgi:predicted nucleic acid-binding Zn ribbon protein